MFATGEFFSESTSAEHCSTILAMAFKYARMHRRAAFSFVQVLELCECSQPTGSVVRND
jgi:hypothetical protein